MNVLNWLRRDSATTSGSSDPTGFDRLTRDLAVGLTRRSMMTRGLQAGFGAIGLSQLGVLHGFETPAAVASILDPILGSCSSCYGDCDCKSCSPACCSPDGSYCVRENEVCCNSGCSSFRRAKVKVCNDHSVSASCPSCSGLLNLADPDATPLPATGIAAAMATNLVRRTHGLFEPPLNAQNTPNASLWSANPMLGSQPNQVYLGRVFVELWDGDRSIVEIGGLPLVEAAWIALTNNLYAAASPAQGPWTSVPVTRQPVAGSAFQGRVVLELWSETAKVAQLGPQADLLTQTKAVLEDVMESRPGWAPHENPS